MAKATTKKKTPNVPAQRQSTALVAGGTSMRAIASKGTGLENVTASDLLIPRITILQGLSPQVNKSREEYIKGAEPGIICDVGLRKLLGTEIIYIPCFYAKIYLEWAPRGKGKSRGKGLINNHGTDPAILLKTTRDDKNRATLPNGNYIAETATFFGLNCSSNNRRSFIPMASTALSVARYWLGLITDERATDDEGEFQPAMFERAWTLGIAERHNDDGDWYVFKPEPAMGVRQMDPSLKLLNEAQAFFEQAKAGLVRADIRNLSAEETGRRGNEPDSDDTDDDDTM